VKSCCCLELSPTADEIPWKTLYTSCWTEVKSCCCLELSPTANESPCKKLCTSCWRKVKSCCCLELSPTANESACKKLCTSCWRKLQTTTICTKVVAVWSYLQQPTRVLARSFVQVVGENSKQQQQLGGVSNSQRDSLEEALYKLLEELQTTTICTSCWRELQTTTTVRRSYLQQPTRVLGRSFVQVVEENSKQQQM
jgi:hypothetical protein